MSDRRRVSATGPADSPYLLIGEAPGQDEHARGYAFCGDSGQVLDAYLMRLGHPRHTVRVTNLSPWWPGKGNPDPPLEDVVENWPSLMAEIRAQQPERVVCLGAVAASHVLAGSDADGLDLDYCNGRAVWQELPDAEWAGLVIPVYHPAAGLHDPHYSGLCFQGLRAALAPGIRPPSGPSTTAKLATALDVETALGLEDGLLETDTEGYAEDPWCLTFGFYGNGFLIPAEDADLLTYFDRRRRETHTRLLLHNSLHDLAVLRALGINLQPGEYEDSMIRAFACQLATPSGQGLKPLAYRFCGVRMQGFDDVMAATTARVEHEYLASVLAAVEENEIPVLGRAHPIAKRVAGILKPDKRGVKSPKTLRQKWKGVCDDYPVLAGLAAEVCGPWPRPQRKHVDLSVLTPYACADADMAGRVDTQLRTRMASLGVEDAYRVDLAVVPVLERMRDTGMLVDRERLHGLEILVRETHDELERRLQDYAGDKDFNPRSGPAVAELLYERMGLVTPRKTPDGSRFSTDKKALGMAKPGRGARADAADCLAALREYRVVETVQDRYVLPLWDFIRPDGRVHPNWNHTLVVSGRLSTNAPNILAFPARSVWGELFRSCFRAPEGRAYVSIDLSQIELRVLASESQDAAMCGIFQRGEDLHDATCREVFGVTPEHPLWDLFRTFAKTINFGIAYGLTAYGLQQNLAAMAIFKSEDECQAIIDQWYAARPGVLPYFARVLAETRRHGFVRDLSGRIRWLPNIWVPVDKLRAAAERAAQNLAIQGGAQFAEKLGMAEYWLRRGELQRLGYCEPLLQVHDDMVFEADEDNAAELGARIARIMTEAAQSRFRVPITAAVKVGRSWGEMHKEDATSAWREAAEEAAA